MSHWRDFLDSTAPSGSYLAWKEVARRTSLSRTTAWRLQKRGEFPAPYAISPGRVGYREDEVEAWRVSRDHSPAWEQPLAGPERRLVSPTPEAPTIATSPEKSRTESKVTKSAAAPVTSAPAPEPVPRDRRQATPPPGASRRPRRRSEHARAIAQQMLFDF